LAFRPVARSARCRGAAGGCSASRCARPGPAAAPFPPDSEVDLLKSMLTLARDYLDIPTVEEDERLKMEKITTSLQLLLADNQRMSDQVTGSSPQTRKLLGGT
jgi:hypothetical protein